MEWYGASANASGGFDAIVSVSVVILFEFVFVCVVMNVCELLVVVLD